VSPRPDPEAPVPTPVPRGEAPAGTSGIADRPRIVVFSDDWGRHPSSSQHLVRALLGRYRVDWVQTIGTRRPRPTLADARRGLEKLGQWLRPRPPENPAPSNAAPTGAAPEGLRIHAPVHWPGFGTRLERKVNERLLWRALRPILYGTPRPRAVITTASITADLARRTADLPWLYYCVDDLSEWPGLDARALRTMELDLLPHMRAIVAVSENLRERLRGLGYASELLTHGIDAAHWQRTAELRRTVTDLRERARNPRPIALYWGHADRRLDAPVCRAIADRMELRMVGPRTDVDPSLSAHANVHWLGPVPYAELPEHAARADVLVMPYADLPVTRAMQPLKLKEYLATGLPVVATPLPANLEWSAAMDITAAPAAFVARALERARDGLPAEQAAARELLADEGWETKARAFEGWFPGGGE